MGRMTESPHDALFQLAFSSVEHASAALRVMLPAELAGAIDFATLSPVPASFVDGKLDGRRSDLLFSANIAGRESFVFGDDASLLRREMTALGRLVLFLFRHARERDGIFARMVEVVGPLVEVARSPHGGAAFSAILVYLQTVTRRDEAEVVMALQQAVGESVYEQILYAGERLEQRAEQKGLEKGLARQQGMLLLMLRSRFGELPSWAVDHVKACDADMLDRIAGRFIGSPTLVEALGKDVEKARAKAAPKAPRRRGRTR
jgi:hypothetical protein